MSTLKINGTDYSESARATNKIRIERLRKSLDEYDELEFIQYRATLAGITWKGGQAVEWSDGGTPYFKGHIVQVDPRFTPHGWVVRYQCYGLKWVGNRVPITNASDSSGSIIYNLPSDDPDYNASLSGLSLASILTELFDDHASALSAKGIAGYVAGDLTPLTMVPNEPVIISGTNFFNVIDSLLEQWAGNYACYVEYYSGTADWRIRIKAITSFTSTTLTLGVDPIEPPSISRDISQCFTRAVARGAAKTEPAHLSTANGTLEETWSGSDETNWAWNDWAEPAGAVDRGTITVVGSTTVTVQSSDSTRTWATNFWSDNEGAIWVINSVATGITQQEYRLVTACGSLSAGGTAQITLDRALVNGGYTSYRLICKPVNTLVDVYRRYDINNTQVAANLANKFSPPCNVAHNGVLRGGVAYPVGIVALDGVEWPANLEIDLANQQIVYSEPVVKPFNTQANLDAGGASVDKPDDVIAIVPYSRGTLTAVKPSSSYEGTAYTIEGLEETLYFDIPTWISEGDQAQIEALLQAKLDTVKDTIVSGTVVYHGKYSTALQIGIKLRIAASSPSFTTGWETLDAPVREIVLDWPADGADIWTTTMQISNRRKQAAGDSFYLSPAFAGGAAWDVPDPGFVLPVYQPMGMGRKPAWIKAEG